MADNKLTLAPNFSIPAVDYAGQGNAILGIRDAGKTSALFQLIFQGKSLIRF
jgi:predicted AAA+ superfamily ATPase